MNPCLQTLLLNFILAVKVGGIVVVVSADRFLVGKDLFGFRFVEGGVLLVSSRRPCDDKPFSTA